MSGPALVLRRGRKVARIWGPCADRATAMTAAEVRVYVGSGTWTVPVDLADDVLAYAQSERLLAVEARR